MKAKAFWCTSEELKGEIGELFTVSFSIRGKGKTLDHKQLFLNAVTALRKHMRNAGCEKPLEELFLSHIHTEVGQVVHYEVMSNTEVEGTLTKEKEMSTRKRTAKKSTKSTAKKTASKKSTTKKPSAHAVADRKTQKVSITKATYALLNKFGPENVTVEMATELAMKVNKTSKFNKWHLYFHRKNYRSADLAGELQDKLDTDNPVIRRLIGALKNKPIKNGAKKASPKKVAKVAKSGKTKKRVVRIKKRARK